MAEAAPPVDPADPCYVFGRVLDGHGGALDYAYQPDALGPRWFHVDYSSVTAEAWLLRAGVGPVVAESLVRLDTRPRAMPIDAGVLLVLRGVNLNAGADPEDMVSLRLWIEPERLITVRQRRLMSAQDVKASLDQGTGPRNVPDLVAEIVERIADRIAEFVDAIEDRITVHETAIGSGEGGRVRADVSATRRQIAVVRRYLAPQRDALEGLYRHAKSHLSDQHAYQIREQSDRITRYVEDLDLARERTLVLQEELLNAIAQQQNQRMYVLSVVAAVFLPVTFITGLFGMNVGGLPGVERPDAFWILAAVMVAVSLGIVLWLVRRRWL